MLDKRTEKMLSIINTQCEEGSYKILEIDELLSLLPSKYHLDREGLKDIINYLCEREYIKSKYFDEKVYCISPLPKGRLYHENAVLEIKNKFSYKKLVFAAFLGSVFGGILGAAFYAVILKILGGF